MLLIGSTLHAADCWVRSEDLSPLKGSNWFARPFDLGGKAWKDDLALLDDEHGRLREVVASLKPAALGFTPATSKVSNLALICGVANHDVYHAGQIQLLKRLQK